MHGRWQARPVPVKSRNMGFRSRPLRKLGGEGLAAAAVSAVCNRQVAQRSQPDWIWHLLQLIQVVKLTQRPHFADSRR